MKLSVVTTLSLALWAAAPAPMTFDRNSAVKSRVTQIFAAYRTSQNNKAAWDFPVYSQKLRAIIARWRRGSDHREMTDLVESDWFCQCQDWDPKTFRLVGQTFSLSDANRAQAQVRFTVDGRTIATARVMLVREMGLWQVDDLFTPDLPKGLKAAMLEEMANPG